MKVFFAIYFLICVLFSSYDAKNVKNSENFEQYFQNGDFIVADFMNESVDPCDDFYQYACGNWPKVNPKRAYDLNFDKFIYLADKHIENIAEILNDGKNFAADETLKKARNYFRSCIDGEIFNFRPIPDYQKLIEDVFGKIFESNWNSTEFDWVKATATLKTYDLEVFLAAKVSDNVLTISSNYFMSPIEFVAIASENWKQPESEEYLENQSLMKRLLVLYGLDSSDAGIMSNKIMQLLVELKTTLNATTYFDYTRKKVDSIEQLSATLPEIQWDSYFSIALKDLNVSKPGGIIVRQIDTLKELQLILNRTDRKVLATYFVLKFLFHLHDEFRAVKQPPYYCAKMVKDRMPEIINFIYVKQIYNETMEKDILEIFVNVKTVYVMLLNESTILDDDLKRTLFQSLDRLECEFLKSIPSKIILDEKYKNLIINADNFYQNNLNYFRQNNIEKLNDPPNIDPLHVSTGYDTDFNKIYIPAGFLSWPFYQMNMSKNYAYAILGSFLGREMVHVFTELARTYDIYGNRLSLWNNRTFEIMKNRVDCFRKQYSQYEIEELGKNLDGSKSFFRNIDDSLGLKLSYFAYRQFFEKSNNKEQSSDDLMKKFFISFAQIYCTSMDQSRLLKLMDSYYAPARYRVLGTVSNFDKFSETFKCASDSKMSWKVKCNIL